MDKYGKLDSILKRNKLDPDAPLLNPQRANDFFGEVFKYNKDKSNRDIFSTAVPASPAGKIGRVVKKYTTGPFMDAYSTVGKALNAKPYSLEEATNFTMAGMAASMPGGPVTGNDSELAVIKQPKHIVATIRKILKNEYKARGPKTGTSVDALLRRTVYRGDYNKRWPVGEGGKAPDFRNITPSGGNVGEPLGVSSTFDPEVANAYSSGGEFSRAVPLYGGKPEDVILNSLRVDHGEDLLTGYKKALSMELDKASKNKITKMLSSGRPWEHIDSPAFNRVLTNHLEIKGYKGVLYHTGRYNESELKMFNPADLLHLDKRNRTDSAVVRYNEIVQPSPSTSTKAYREYMWMGHDATDAYPLGLDGTSLGELVYQNLDVPNFINEHPAGQKILNDFLTSFGRDKIKRVVKTAQDAVNAEHLLLNTGKYSFAGRSKLIPAVVDDYVSANKRDIAKGVVCPLYPLPEFLQDMSLAEKGEGGLPIIIRKLANPELTRDLPELVTFKAKRQLIKRIKEMPHYTGKEVNFWVGQLKGNNTP